MPERDFIPYFISVSDFKMEMKDKILKSQWNFKCQKRLKTLKFLYAFLTEHRIQTAKQGFFQQIWEKAPGQNWEKWST